MLDIEQIWVIYAYDENNMEYAVLAFNWYSDAEKYANSIELTTRIGSLNCFRRSGESESAQQGD